MFTMTGKYSNASVMTDNVEATALSQIQAFLNHPAFQSSTISIMPDVHAGKGSVIGFTSTLGKYIIPNVVGVDIGCGVLAILLGSMKIDFQKLDDFIRENIPMGTGVRAKEIKNLFAPIGFDKLKKVSDEIGIDSNRPVLSVGSLGSGNHFIEVDQDNHGRYWLVIHTGSRNFGKQICEFHQRKAVEYTQTTTGTNMKFKDLEYLPIDGADAALGNAYLEHMKVAQGMATMNRRAIAHQIVRYLIGTAEPLSAIESVHNYIDFGPAVPIIRKGAISARTRERVLIPMNMKYGTVVATGKGLSEYNMSAPHGAGRTMSRSKAKKTLDLDEFKNDMAGVWSTSVGQGTLDESPDAYKDPNEILTNLAPLVNVEFTMKSVYNIKAGEKED